MRRGAGWGGEPLVGEGREKSLCVSVSLWLIVRGARDAQEISPPRHQDQARWSQARRGRRGGGGNASKENDLMEESNMTRAARIYV